MLASNPKILIVDDEESILNSLGKILKKSGYSVDLAQNAKQALELCAINFYDGIIVDCLLPDKSGLVLARDIRREQNQLPHIIFMSGVYGDPSFINSCLKEVGGSRFYTKPFNALDLLNYLNELFKGKIANPQIIARIFTLPNPSVEDFLDGYSERQKIVGYELPMILAQFANLKISRNVDIYRENEICCQLRFYKGSLVQCYLFIENEFESTKVDLQNLNSLVSSQKINLHIYTSNNSKVNIIYDNCAIVKWAEKRTFTHIPIYWVVSRIFPVLGGKLYSKLNHIEDKSILGWPLLRPEKFSLPAILNRSVLSLLLDLGSYKEEFFKCLYNYFLNGSIWVDILKPKYEEESLDQFFSWHYNLIAKRNYFEVLEISQDENDSQSEMAKVYYSCFKEIKEYIHSKKIDEWIAMESGVIQSAIKKLEDRAGRERYREGLRKSCLAQNLAIKKVYLDIFESFEQNNYELASERLRTVQDWECAPAELKLIKIWSDLKRYQPGSHIRELEVALQKVCHKNQFNYIQRLNQGLIQKHKNNRPVSRRLFLESHKLNPASKVPMREVNDLRPSSPSVVLWAQKWFKEFRIKGLLIPR